MSYREIALDKKAKAVKRVLRGEMATAVAADLGIDRNSLALWVRRVFDAISSNLGRRKRKKKRMRDKTKLRNVAQLNRLRRKIAKQEKTIAELRDSLKSSVKAPVPKRCPACGRKKFHKYGMLKISLARLFGKKLGDAKLVAQVQKFVCANCGYSTHLKGPLALFHWAMKSYR